MHAVYISVLQVSIHTGCIDRRNPEIYPTVEMYTQKRLGTEKTRFYIVEMFRSHIHRIAASLCAFLQVTEFAGKAAVPFSGMFKFQKAFFLHPKTDELHGRVQLQKGPLGNALYPLYYKASVTLSLLPGMPHSCAPVLCLPAACLHTLTSCMHVLLGPPWHLLGTQCWLNKALNGTGSC